MTKVDVLKQIISVLTKNQIDEIKGETIVDCLKQIVIFLDKDANTNECYTIVDCLNLINKIKGSKNTFQTKTECLKEMISIQDKSIKLDNLMTISDCIDKLVCIIDKTSNIEDGSIADKLLLLKTAINNLPTHEHTPSEERTVTIDVGNGKHQTNTIKDICIDETCSEYGKTIVVSQGTLDDHNYNGQGKCTKCNYQCGHERGKFIEENEYEENQDIISCDICGNMVSVDKGTYTNTSEGGE